MDLTSTIVEIIAYPLAIHGWSHKLSTMFETEHYLFNWPEDISGLQDVMCELVSCMTGEDEYILVFLSYFLNS